METMPRARATQGWIRTVRWSGCPLFMSRWLISKHGKRGCRPEPVNNVFLSRPATMPRVARRHENCAPRRSALAGYSSCFRSCGISGHGRRTFARAYAGGGFAPLQDVEDEQELMATLSPERPGAAKVQNMLEELSQEQREVVFAPPGTTRVIAGPGSGKTRVLIARVAFRIFEGHPPDQTLAITFTNKAAGELKQRLRATLGRSVARCVTACTFHKLGLGILREHITDVPKLQRSEKFIVYDTTDAAAALKDVLLEDPKLRSYKASAKGIARGISLLKCSNAFLHTMSPYDALRQLPSQRRLECFKDLRDSSIARVLRGYESALQLQNAVDFDDMLLLPCTILHNRADVRRKLQAWYRQILVDEFQDLNLPQYALLKLLAPPLGSEDGRAPDLFMVGDPNQSIYGFRGANSSTIQELVEREYQPLTDYMLQDNYRSRPGIVSASDAVLREGGPPRLYQKMTSRRQQGHNCVQVEVFETREQEADGVAGLVKHLHSNRGIELHDIAVLIRSSRLDAGLQASFVRAGIPYHSLAGFPFWDRAEVRDAVAYVRLVVNPLDEQALLRILNRPRRQIGPKTHEQLRAAAKQEGVTLSMLLFQDCLALAANGRAGQTLGVKEPSAVQLEELLPPLPEHWGAITKRQHRHLRTLRGLVAAARQLAQRQQPPGRVIDFLLRAAGWWAFIEQEGEEAGARQSRAERIQLLQDTADELWAGLTRDTSPGSGSASQPGMKGLELLLEQAALMDRIGGGAGAEGAREAATISTIHRAKGLEWRAVIMPGMEEGQLPTYMALKEDSWDALMEEKRVAFVGATRAKDLLILTHAARLNSAGSDNPRSTQPSRYLSRILESE